MESTYTYFTEDSPNMSRENYDVVINPVRQARQIDLGIIDVWVFFLVLGEELLLCWLAFWATARATSPLIDLRSFAIT
jgi:hypothetical protein